MVVKLLIANKNEVQNMRNNLKYRTAELWLQDGLMDINNEQVIGIETEPNEHHKTGIGEGNLICNLKP